jgi:hypothetical protein
MRSASSARAKIQSSSAMRLHEGAEASACRATMAVRLASDARDLLFFHHAIASTSALLLSTTPVGLDEDRLPLWDRVVHDGREAGRARSTAPAARSGRGAR